MPRILSTGERPTLVEIDRAPQVELCQLDPQGKTHSGELVKVQARYLQGFEASILLDQACEQNRVWVELDESRMRRLSPSSALSAFEQLLTQAHDVPPGVSGEANLDVVLVGRLDGPTPHKRGYGHLNEKMQLTVYSVQNAQPWVPQPLQIPVV